ncbi:MAG: helix-turn-helix domain-containing protein [Anaerolineae bacterium]|nr:helix-turn-helix domain-containing protein [Anaerolineae bacterium]
MPEEARIPAGTGSDANENDMLTIAQVAKYLKLHELTVRRLAREGELPAFKVGRQWRVKRDLLEKWIGERSGRGS